MTSQPPVPPTDRSAVPSGYVRRQMADRIALARLQQGRWDLAGALDTLSRVIEESRDAGIHGVTVLTARRMHAEIHLDLGDTERAYQLAAELFDDCTAQLGPDHPATIRTCVLLAAVHHHLGDPDTAESLCRQIVATADSRAQPARRAVLLAQVHLALITADRGDRAAAIESLTGTLDRFRDHYGDHDLDTVRITAELADLHRAVGDTAAGRRLLTRAHHDARFRLGGAHPFTTGLERHLTRLEPPMPYNGEGPDPVPAEWDKPSRRDRAPSRRRWGWAWPLRRRPAGRTSSPEPVPDPPTPAVPRQRREPLEALEPRPLPESSDWPEPPDWPELPAAASDPSEAPSAAVPQAPAAQPVDQPDRPELPGADVFERELFEQPVFRPAEPLDWPELPGADVPEWIDSPAAQPADPPDWPEPPDWPTLPAAGPAVPAAESPGSTAAQPEVPAPQWPQLSTAPTTGWPEWPETPPARPVVPAPDWPELPAAHPRVPAPDRPEVPSTDPRDRPELPPAGPPDWPALPGVPSVSRPDGLEPFPDELEPSTARSGAPDQPGSQWLTPTDPDEPAQWRPFEVPGREPERLSGTDSGQRSRWTPAEASRVRLTAVPRRAAGPRYATGTARRIGRRARWPVIAVAATVLGGLLAVVAVHEAGRVLSSVGGGSASRSGTHPTGAVSSGGVVLTLLPDADEITISWTDPSAGRATPIVSLSTAAGQTVVTTTLPPGTTSYVRQHLDPRLDYCVLLALYLTPADTSAVGTRACTHRVPPDPSASPGG